MTQYKAGGFACSVPDFLAVGGDVTDSMEYVSSLVIDCMVKDKQAILHRQRLGLDVSAMLYATK